MGAIIKRAGELVELSWAPVPSKTKSTWERLGGIPDALVKISPMEPKGFLWTYKTVCGYESTVELAREQVEAFCEFGPGYRRAALG